MITIDDFMKKVEKTETCWLWLGGIQAGGYGAIWLRKKNWRSHRISYMIFNGPIENGLFVCHKCDVRLCVNPNHLFLGTAKDNAHDAFKKGRMSPMGRPDNFINKNNPRGSKLTPSQVLQIRELLREGNACSEIAQNFGVGYTAIHKIKEGVNWKHI